VTRTFTDGPNKQSIGLTYQVTVGPLRLIQGSFCNADAEGMPGKNDKTTFKGREPSTLFREFAAECMELAQTATSPEKGAVPENGQCLVSDGGAQGKEKLAKYLLTKYARLVI
jgi:hypothetical protein